MTPQELKDKLVAVTESIMENNLPSFEKLKTEYVDAKNLAVEASIEEQIKIEMDFIGECHLKSVLLTPMPVDIRGSFDDSYKYVNQEILSITDSDPHFNTDTLKDLIKNWKITDEFISNAESVKQKQTSLGSIFGLLSTLAALAIAANASGDSGETEFIHNSSGNDNSTAEEFPYTHLVFLLVSTTTIKVLREYNHKEMEQALNRLWDQIYGCFGKSFPINLDYMYHPTAHFFEAASICPQLALGFLYLGTLDPDNPHWISANILSPIAGLTVGRLVSAGWDNAVYGYKYLSNRIKRGPQATTTSETTRLINNTPR